ncbi:MAG: hypothetical protein HXY52_03530 [Nitrospirae bacterium]|jgi:hypothetical protein|nr:hypothetical protein [Nitrospirota bacterium]
MDGSERIDMSVKKTKDFKGIKLGQFLLSGNIISKESLEKALQTHIKTNQMLGEILISMGVIDPLELKAVLEINKNIKSIQDALTLAAGIKKQLGSLLIQAGNITQQQLETALNIQKNTGEKLGSILVKLGYITENQLEALLLFQKNQSEKPYKINNLRLGKLLVTTELISEQQLEDALEEQKYSSAKIGDILVQKGYLSNTALSKALNLQNKLISALLTIILIFAPFITAQAADKTDIAVSGSTESHTALKIIYHTTEIEISSEDINRGYIELPSAAQLEIQNYNLSGYIVVFKGLSEPFREILIEGLDQEVKVTAEGAMTSQPYHGRDPLMVKLKYKIILSDNIKPGKYKLPLEISVSPLIFV